jgi:molybdate transport system ATP-binding protein
MKPLSAVDYSTRQRLQEALAAVHRRFNLTTVLVSHDPAEVNTLADRVIELDLGRMRQDGPPPSLPSGSECLHLSATVVEMLPGNQFRLRVGADENTFVVTLPAGKTYQLDQQLMLRASAWVVEAPGFFKP